MARSLKHIIGILKVWYEMKSWRSATVLSLGLLGLLCNAAFPQDSSSIVWRRARVGMCSARLGDRLFLIGGAAPPAQTMQGADAFQSLLGTAMVDVFDFKTMTWDTVAPLNTPRVYATAVALDDSIYVMGGVDDRGIVLRSVEVYDQMSKEWHYASHMLLAREGAASVVYGDSIFVFGGGGNFNNLQHTVEVYSPATGAWDSVIALLYGRAFHHVVKRGRYIYVFGGIGSILGTVVGPIRFIERYDPAEGSAQIALLWDEPRAFFETVDRNDSVFAISGYGSTSEDEYYGDVYLLDFHVSGFETQDKLKISLDTARAGFVADTGNDGKIYLFGGYSPEYKGGTVPVPSVDIIEPTVSAFNAVVQNNGDEPQDFSLSQNYPNPFNPTTTIEFQVPLPGSRVRLEVFNTLGQKVSTLVDRFVNSGKNSVVFAGENLPSGAYIYTLQIGNGIIYRKMVLVK